MGKDTWVVAHCMARLPRRTYFSHPESSLDAFFSGEAKTKIGGEHRGGYTSSTAQGSAAHELQFLSSLSQSLGIDSPTTNDKAVELDFSRYEHHRHSSAMSDERSANLPLRSFSDYLCFSETSETPTSSSDPIFSFPSPSPDMQAPAMSPFTQDVASCKDLYSPQPEQAQVATNDTRDSSRYQCNWKIAQNQLCGEWIEGGSKEVWTHVRTAHGLKGRYGGWCHCKWGGCQDMLKVSSMQRHLDKHLEVKWRCSDCDATFSRHDSARKHIRSSEECHGAHAVPHAVSEQSLVVPIGQVTTGVAEDSLTGGHLLETSLEKVSNSGNPLPPTTYTMSYSTMFNTDTFFHMSNCPGYL